MIQGTDFRSSTDIEEDLYSRQKFITIDTRAIIELFNWQRVGRVVLPMIEGCEGAIPLGVWYDTELDQFAIKLAKADWPKLNTGEPIPCIRPKIQVFEIPRTE